MDRRKTLGTLGLIIGMFLAALEGTVVAPAMPAVVTDLGGVDLYALPFSIYLLTQTVSSPLWGKLSDMAGRKNLYLVGVAFFLVGSGLCGLAHTMPFLIAMRVIQGLGAGCVVPLTYTMVGEQYTVQNRAKVQGFISAVWGLSGLLGPLVGGLIVDYISWHWVFLLNIPFGIVASVLVILFMVDKPREREPFSIDVPGTILLVVGVSLLVWGLDQQIPLMVGCGILSIIAALPFEMKSPVPLLPMRSLQNPIVGKCLLNNLLAGAAYFGALAYIPLFVQEIVGGKATATGIVLTPMILSWTASSMLGARILGLMTLFTFALSGFTLLAIGFLGFSLSIPFGLYPMAASGAVAGFGMGSGVLATLLLVQEYSKKSEFGAATAGTIFSRTVGGALGVSLMSMLIGPMKGVGAAVLAQGLQRGFFLGLSLAIVAFGVSVLMWRRGGAPPTGD